MSHPAVAEDRRHAPKGNVVRLALVVLLHVGKKSKAVGTAVPEYLQDLDLIRCVGGLRRRYQIVLATWIDPGPLGCHGGQHRRRQEQRQGRDD